MPNLNSLVSASLSVDPNAQRLALIERIESWLVLPPDAAKSHCLGAVSGESDARQLNDMLVFRRFSLCRDLGITPGPGGEQRFTQLAAGYASSTLPAADRAAYEKLNVAFALGTAMLQAYPALATPPPVPADEAALRAQLDALYQRQQEAQKYTVPPLVTPERLDAMVALVADYRALLNTVAPGRKIHTDISFFAAHATYALARGWQQLGRNDRAAKAYAEAVPLFKFGERPKDAADAQQLARRLGYAEKSDFDGASAEQLRTLIDGDADAYARAGAYAQLAALSTAANSAFDAAHYAEQAAEALASCGYADPEAADFDAAIQKSIDNAVRPDALPLKHNPVERINEVVQLYVQILGVRFASRTAQGLPSAANAQTTIDRLFAVTSEMSRQIEAAHEHVMTELARYRP